MSKTKIDEPCLSCKIISVSCLFGIGGYLFYIGRKQPIVTKSIFFSLGTASAALGCGEIFNKSPFR